MNADKEHKSPYPDFVLWLTKAVSRFSYTVILLLILMTITIIFGGGILSQRIEDQNNSAEIRQTVITLVSISQEMRRREKDFFLRKDFVFSDKYYVLSNQALRIIDKLKTMKDGDKYYRAITRLGEVLQFHNQQFGLTILTQQNLGITKNNGLYGEITRNMAFIEKNLDDISASPELRNLWLNLKTRFLIFMVDDEIPEKVFIEQVSEKTRKILEKMRVNKDVSNKFMSLMDRFVFQMSNMQVQKQIYVEETAKLTTIFHDFEIEVDNIIDATQVDSRDRYEEVLATIYGWNVLFSLLVLISTLIIGVFAIIIVRKIAKVRKL